MQFKPISLSEEKKVPDVVQLLRTGKFEDLEVTKEMLSLFKKNFESKVRGYEDGQLPIDYFHENEKIAAGWIKTLSISQDGEELWAEVSWTPGGSQKIVDGELRYISVEFSFDYQDNESGKKFGPTLFGAGLTNRPYVKGMAPIKTLSEKEKGKFKMNLEEAIQKIKDLETDKEKMSQELSDLKKKYDEKEKKMAENEKKGAFDKMLSEGKAIEAQRDSYMSGDMAKFADLAKPLNLDGKGSSQDNKDDKSLDDPQEEINRLAEKMSKEEKISIGAAISKVLKTNKELSEKYKAIFAGGR